MPRVIERLEAARAAGTDVSFDMYPYPAGSTYLLQLLPPEAMAGGQAALLARLDDPAHCAALRRWVEEGGDDPHRQSKVSLIAGRTSASPRSARRPSSIWKAATWRRPPTRWASRPST